MKKHKFKVGEVVTVINLPPNFSSFTEGRDYVISELNPMEYGRNPWYGFNKTDHKFPNVLPEEFLVLSEAHQHKLDFDKRLRELINE